MKPKKSPVAMIVSAVVVCALLAGLAYIADSSEAITQKWLDSTHTSSKK